MAESQVHAPSSKPGSLVHSNKLFFSFFFFFFSPRAYRSPPPFHHACTWHLLFSLLFQTSPPLLRPFSAHISGPPHHGRAAAHTPFTSTRQQLPLPRRPASKPATIWASTSALAPALRPAHSSARAKLPMVLLGPTSVRRS